MGKLIFDEELLAKLGALDEEKELCDPSGRPLAVVVPPEQYREMMYALARARIDDAEAERVWQEYQQHGGKTTAEVLEHLKSLDR